MASNNRIKTLESIIDAQLPGVCPGSQHPVIYPNVSASMPAVYECGICNQHVRYDANMNAVTHPHKRV